VIVFVDESGFSERPSRVRSWAPVGQTPVIQYHFNWDQLSIIAGLTRWNCYFRLYPGTVDRFRAAEFLQALARAIPHKLLLIWDQLPAHRSRVVRDFIASLEDRIHLEFLPSYAPELNPVEYIWAWMKKHALAHYCPDTFGELSTMAKSKLQSVKRRKTLILAFWKQAELPL
jgi:transposase